MTVGETALPLLQDIVRIKRQANAYRTFALMLFDENTRLQQRVALLDGTLDRRYLRAWTVRREAWIEDAFNGREPVAARRVA